MTMNKVRRSLLGGLAMGAMLTVGASAWSASTENWPARPVSLVVGFSPGGPTDVVARIVAEQLSNRFGQTFLVENKAGAGGGVAATQVKGARADGYTLMFGSSGTLAIAPNLQSNLQYDPIKDFTTVGLVSSYPYFLLVPASSRFQTLDDLLAAGADPKVQLNFASAGSGAVNHLAGEWFLHEAGIKAAHIPFKGDSAALADLIAGRVDFAFLAGAAALPQVQSGNLRILASASSVPGRGGPGVPTLGEIPKFKGFSAEPWNGVMGPAGLPEDIVQKLNAAINEIMEDATVKERLGAMEQYAFTGSPQDFQRHIEEQKARWGEVIKDTNVEVQ